MGARRIDNPAELFSPGSDQRISRATPLPRKVARTDDPFVVLDHAATIGPATERAVHAQLCRIEFDVVAAAGTQITVVASLAATAVRTFLGMHGLQVYARHLVGRTGPDRSVRPPTPDLITAALHQRAVPVESCLFVGSTDIDLKAARAAGVDTIRHRRPTGKEITAAC